MHWFDILHALLVILIVSQISVGLSNDEVEENTTLEPPTIDPTLQNDSTDDDQKITRRFRFKRPPASAYQPNKHKKPKQIVQELPIPQAPPPPPPQMVPEYTVGWPVAPAEGPMSPPMSMPMPGPMAPSRPMKRPRPRPRPRPMPSQPPAPSIGDFLPSAISGLTNMLAGGGGPPGGGTPNGPLGPLADLLGPLSGLVKPALSALGPLAKTLLGALPLGKTILDLFETIKKLLSFFSDFSLSKLLKFIPDTLKRIMNALCSMFSCIPKLMDKLCRLLGNLFGLIPKTLMLIPRLFRCIHKMPERFERCIELLYRFCKTLEKFLAFIKQAIWNMLRLLGNTVLMPLRIISKTIAEVIYLPIKLLAEPLFAFTELMRAILYPFRRFYHFLLRRLDYIVGELYYLVKWLFGRPSKVHTAVAIVNHPHIPLIRVWPKLSIEPSTSLANYILSKR